MSLIAKEIVCIVPTFYPTLGGVGDYGLLLAQALRETNNFQTNFIVAKNNQQGQFQHDGFCVDVLKVDIFESLKRLLPPGDVTVLLHYEPYGYENRGCPHELIKALTQWKNDYPGGRLLTMFHELYAFGPPWTSSFWLSSVQRRLAQSLAKLSNDCVTSNFKTAKSLSQFTGRPLAQIKVMPIFSNVGEPRQFMPLAKRFPRLVLFGLRTTKERIYSRRRDYLTNICRKIGVKEIWDIGQPFDVRNMEGSEIRIIRKDVMSASAISRILAESMAGFSCYSSPQMLPRSGVFAAFCAHQLVPVVSFDQSCAELREADGLRGGEHYWVADDFDQMWDLAHGQMIAEAAYHWYQPHNLSAHVKEYAQRLECL